MSTEDDIYERLDANKVLDAFGKYGKYQMRTYFLANAVHLLYAINMMIMPFITEEPKFRCKFQDEKTILTKFNKIDECTYFDINNNQTHYCQELPNYYFQHDNKSHSIASQFDLICGEKGAVDHGSSLFLLGGVLVGPIVMQLADLYGRKPTFIISVYTGLVANFLCVMAPSYKFFLMGRFIAGIANTCFASIGITLTMESVSTEFRNLVPIAFNSFWITGYLLAGILKLYINEWRVLYLVATIPGFLCLPYYWLISESVHWMVTMKKYDEMKEYIRKAEKYNGVNIDLLSCQTLETFKNYNVVKRTALDIFKSPALFINLFINGYIFIVLSFTYWALSLFSTELAEDKMTGFFLSGLIEIPGAILTNILIHVWKRKTVSVVSFLIQAICMTSLLFCSKGSIFLLVFPLIAKCFSVVLWSSHPLHCSEATPTSVRSVFLGMVGFLRDIGGVIAPYQKRLAVIDERAPTLLFSFFAFTAAILVVTLAETKDKELPEDIPDFNPGPVFGKCLKHQSSREDLIESEIMTKK